MLKSRRAAIASAGAAALFLALVALAWWNPAGDFWVGVEPPKAQCESYAAAKLASLPRATDELYDPAALRRLLREPQNTVSNFAYFAVGLLVWFRARTVASRTFAIACAFLAVGSGLYHAALLPQWRLLDMMGVYAVLFSLVVVGAAGFRRGDAQPATTANASARAEANFSELPPARTRALVVSGSVVLAAVWCAVHRNDFRWWGRFKPLDSTNLVLALIAVLAALAVRAVVRTPVAGRRAAWRWFTATAAFGLLAGAGGQGDRFHGFWADPTALIQGHTVWHVCGAAALWCAHELFTRDVRGTPGVGAD